MILHINNNIQYRIDINTLLNILQDLDLYTFNTTIQKYSLDHITLPQLINQLPSNLRIYYHDPTIPAFSPVISFQDFELLLSILEQILKYWREDYPLLQIDIHPNNNLTIYTYSQIWEKDFEKFEEIPKNYYTWDNLPKALQNPNSNMQINHYDPNTRIALVYHYYSL